MNCLPGYASTSKLTGGPTAIADTNCSGTVSCTRSGLTRTTTATFSAFGHVVAGRHETLRHQAGERRPHDRVGDRLLRERDSCPSRLQRLVLLRRAVLGRFVLLARGFHLRPPLIEFRLRDDVLVEQRADAVELVLRQLESRLGVLHFRHGVDVERRCPA